MDDRTCTYCGQSGHRVSSCPRRPRERDVERHLVKRVEALGGEIRKAAWIGRRAAPDRRVLVPGRAPMWIELKAPGEQPTGQQLREHNRMRRLGELVEVVDSIDGVDALLGVS